MFLLFALNYSSDVSKGLGLGSSCWVHFFRSTQHNISVMCKSQAWDHLHSHVSQTAAVPCIKSHMGYYRWLLMSKICSGLYTLLAYIPIVSNKYSVHTPIKCCKMAIYSHNHTVASQDFVCTAFLQYGAYPYSASRCRIQYGGEPYSVSSTKIV